MSISPAELQYVISLEEIFWGGTLVAITMAMHGSGMLLILRLTGALKQRFEPHPSFKSGLATLIVASWLIMLVHLTEVVVWAGFFLWKGAFPSHSLAYYFSLNEYTTVGSNFNLPLRWRLLEGMIATAGLLTFAWSTGILLTLAQEFQDQQMQLLKRRREKGGPKPAPSAPAPAAESPK
jgi:voltage-gated potassium channel